jgi:hypothetical protein
MKRMTMSALMLLVPVFALWAWTAGAGWGGGGCPSVGWAKSTEAAQTAAASKNEPYALYFCPESAASYAGEGGTALTAARKDNKKLLTTIFDAPTVPAELKKAGITQFAKVAATSENAEMLKKYGAGANTLVICAPNGDKLLAFAGDNCTQSNVCSALKNFPAQYKAWLAAKKKG